MAYFKINEPNQPVKYIKSVDGSNGTLEFTDKTQEAFYRDSGFFADSEFEFIKFHFKDAYPELEYLTLDNGWCGDIGWAVDAPQEVGVAAAAVEQVAEAVADGGF